ncbi:type IVB secretion system protein IcmH/DotU [Marinobacter sp. SS21]|uniref:type IVB secretion system protein IcmH/DotU n=1 Tax=Marinobacter sp. SS21 TaxID=2979460 RepID=UPI00232D1ECA|nr:type IVB secretion system protein IcmH/DotU [Marinobacter sp. SS21]MDC0662903.1 type IVB secretion system protein IcmH/DotU [Marinobacter sp. SS21]
MAEAPVTETANERRGNPSFSEMLFTERQGAGSVETAVDPSFQLRGVDNNRLIDAANPLLGLVIRVRRLAAFQQVAALYQQVVEEIAELDRTLLEQGYERPVLVAYRYVLCAFIDEAVLGTDWGAHSVWSQQSLLSRFHNETWGGEKVFAILSRMEREPERYRDMLELIHLCLCLGFEGRYKVMANGREEYEQIIRGLQERLLSEAGESVLEPLTQPLSHVAPARNRFRSGLPVWGIGSLFVVAMAGVYKLFHLALNERIGELLRVLEQLPK